MRVTQALACPLHDSTHVAARCMHVQALAGRLPDIRLQHPGLHRMTRTPAHGIAFYCAGRPRNPAAQDRERRSIRPNNDQVLKILTL